MQRVWAQPLRQQLFFAAPLPARADGAGGRPGWATRSFARRSTISPSRRERPRCRTAASIDRELTGLDRMARNLSNNPVVQTLRSRRRRPAARTAAAAARRPLLDIVLVDSAGRMIGHGTAEETFPRRMDRVDVARRPQGHARRHAAAEDAVGDSATSRWRTRRRPIGRDHRRASLSHLNPQLLSEHVRAAACCLKARSSRSRRRTAASLPAASRPNATSARSSMPDGRRCARAAAAAGWRRRRRRLYSEAVVASGPWLVSVGIPMSVASTARSSLWTRSPAILALGLARLAASWCSCCRGG